MVFMVLYKHKCFFYPNPHTPPKTFCEILMKNMIILFIYIFKKLRNGQKMFCSKMSSWFQTEDEKVVIWLAYQLSSYFGSNLGNGFSKYSRK